MDIKSKIKSIFTEGKLEEKASISSILGKKKVLKGLGRKAIKKSKIKSKRKNNYKTQDARRILASKHGVSNALKKVKNKYVMTYAEIAKLMRKYSYTFNKDKGKWLKRKDATDKAKNSTTSNSSEVSTIEKGNDKKEKTADKKAKTKVEKEEDISPNLKSDKKESLKLDLSLPDSSDNGNYVTKESMKSLQARLIAYLLVDNVEEGGWYDAIQLLKGEQGALEFYLPKEKIYEFLETKEITWIEERQVWIDIDGNYPISDDNHGGRQGITARAVLANLGYTNFLDLEVDDSEVQSTIIEMGYNYRDGVWVSPNEPVEEAFIAKRTFPELVTKGLIGNI